MSYSKHTALCFAPGCTRTGEYARNFCSQHYAEFRRVRIANGSWGTADETLHIAMLLPHYEYENPEGEAELAARVEQQEKRS